MKRLRYVIVALFTLVATDAMAWCGELNKAVLIFAEGQLSNRTKRGVERLLGVPLSSVEFVGKGLNKTRLDEQGRSVTNDEKDAVVKLERAIVTLERADATAEERKAALLAAIELTVDIHCMGNILIDKHLEKDFAFSGHNAMQIGFRYYVLSKFSWQKLWHQTFHSRHGHGVFSAEMYVFDWHIATEGMAKHYKREKLAPRRWVERCGERSLQALKTLQPDAVIENFELTELEELNNASLYDAAFRLAALLNDIFK